MPHDKNGKELKAGDIVNVPCLVTNVSTGEEYCNVSLETVEPMYPGDNKSSLTLNAKQVEKVETAVDQADGGGNAGDPIDETPAQEPATVE